MRSDNKHKSASREDLGAPGLHTSGHSRRQQAERANCSSLHAWFGWMRLRLAEPSPPLHPQFITIRQTREPWFFGKQMHQSHPGNHEPTARAIPVGLSRQFSWGQRGPGNGARFPAAVREAGSEVSEQSFPSPCHFRVGRQLNPQCGRGGPNRASPALGRLCRGPFLPVEKKNP